MRTKHGFCTLHRIAYLRSLDPTCPQCTMAGLQATQTDYNPEATATVQIAVGAPVDDSGSTISPEELDAM